VAEITQIAHDVFTFAFVTAMRQTLLMPIILLAVGALSCLAIKEPRRTATPPAREPAITTEPATPAA
jgi:hypothetical protein